MVGLTSPGHRCGLQVCNEGTASCNRNLRPLPRSTFCSQLRRCVSSLVRLSHSTTLIPPSPVQASGLGASTAEYTWHWHVTLGTPGLQSCCEDCVGGGFRQSQSGFRKELFSYLLVL